MPDDVKISFENPECDKQKALTWISTVTEDGDPHLVPVCFVKSIANDKLLIGVSFISKTVSNIKNGSPV
jgi:predicted pyridoxine 5'-phosphate oxidase superfamily flavin-nucleotide-binding protein